MNAESESGNIQRTAVGPDPPDSPDRAFAKADREVGEIRIGGCRRGRAAEQASLAAGRGFAAHDLFERRRPDHLTGQSRAAVDARDRRALGRSHYVEIRKPRSDD